jgi:hypothetical protein
MSSGMPTGQWRPRIPPADTISAGVSRLDSGPPNNEMKLILHGHPVPLSRGQVHRRGRPPLDANGRRDDLVALGVVERAPLNRTFDREPSETIAGPPQKQM